jgi:amino acid transporter
MTGPAAEPRIVAEVGGLAVAEQGPLVLVVDRGTGPWATVAFVLGVVALVFGGFGAVALSLSARANAPLPWWLCAIFLLVGICSAGGAIAVVARIRGTRTKPLSDYPPVAVFDRANRVFVEAGVVVAPLDQTRFQRRTQVTSSSPVLVAVTPGGTRVLKRGNPFNGGIGNLDEVLTALVFSPNR